MKSKIVPSSELSTKTLRASDYVGVSRRGAVGYYAVVTTRDTGRIVLYRTDEFGALDMNVWDPVDWEDNPGAVVDIVSAVALALRFPKRADEKYKKLGKL